MDLEGRGAHVTLFLSESPIRFEELRAQMVCGSEHGQWVSSLVASEAVMD